MKNLKVYLITGAIFVAISGTLLHFAYEFSGRNALVGLFTPVNESTWEHIKLIFFPMLIFFLFENKAVKKEYPCINSAIAAGILSGSLLIPTIFYTYSGILGYNLAIIDIATFYISVISSFYIIYKNAKSCNAYKYKTLLNTLILILFVAFIIFTIFPPEIALFVSP